MNLYQCFPGVVFRGGMVGGKVVAIGGMYTRYLLNEGKRAITGVLETEVLDDDSEPVRAVRNEGFMD